ncbi:hypothetical protein EOS_03385 [Caballeronia mineralivorans PML1(12)]|uniref:Uncharacterized protein n=2 Tax=Caballeronia mineralivorans TaxID=2010198 RepID=A0A0J1D4R5_9BURK|nr:hypothetical protein EOS_03385 [Caballeronia mineralivorans PML1(12)]
MYKYLSRRWADTLVTVGNTRVGTLHDFRSLEHGPGISDPEEGKKEIRASFDEPETFVGGAASGDAMAQLGVFKVAEGASATFSGLSIVRPIDHPDCYVWCASREKSRKAMSRIDGADTCVEITNVGAFFRELGVALAALCTVSRVGAGPVTYNERTEEWNRANLGIHPAFLKGPSFADQDEVRGVWAPNPAEGSLKAKFIDKSNLYKYCRIVDLP